MMTEAEKLQVQIFANLSLGLIAAAFTTLAGIVGGFALNAGKLPLGYSFVVGIVAALACVCLILSIGCGGRGISATHDTLKSSPSPLPDNYEKGNFDRQAKTGVAGLALGVIVFFLIGYAPSRTTPEVQICCLICRMYKRK